MSGSSEGVVAETLPNSLYHVELSTGEKVRCHLSTELKRSIVRLLPGEKVTVELSQFDPTRGRITQKVS